MDYEFLSRINKYLNEYYQTKINALLTAKDHGQMRELQGSISAIASFKAMISEANNPISKEKEISVEQAQYNV